nr:MAG: phasin family protein [Hyphomicrobiales bacterium]
MATASKTKKTETNGAEAVETVLKNVAESLKEGFEKFGHSYEQVIAFNKDTAEAVMESATKASRGVETINSEVISYSRQTVEEGIAATKAMLAAKTLQDVLECQSRFTKAAFETYVEEMTKVREMALDIAKTASAPLQARMSALSELVQKQAA